MVSSFDRPSRMSVFHLVIVFRKPVRGFFLHFFNTFGKLARRIPARMPDIADKKEKVLRQIEMRGNPTSREIGQNIHGINPDEATKIAKTLIADGLVVPINTSRTTRYSIPKEEV